ncbi:MAG: DNA ligase (NAD+) [Sulfurimonas sp.]|uniref:BRCT domain-containing protein n=1 Tax=Sulfurimonas sp. TaxID=2022749 RepID=UPI0039E4383F
MTRLQTILEPLEPVKKKEAKENPFKTKTVVLAGTMSELRGAIKEILENLGGIVSSLVSKKQTF